MELSILTTPITDPVTVTQAKLFMGYPTTDQDTIIANMITVARQWLEARTGFSCVSKSYKAYFERDDALDNWYELPMVPVLAAPAITITVCGIATTFEQKGLRRVFIRPDTTWSTIGVGSTIEIYYLEATFQAGETSETANECIKRIVASMFNDRQDGRSSGAGVSFARLPYDTIQLINSINTNTGF
jgi:uncharacterized phiE125 gp8 family phage protein